MIWLVAMESSPVTMAVVCAWHGRVPQWSYIHDYVMPFSTQELCHWLYIGLVFVFDHIVWSKRSWLFASALCHLSKGWLRCASKLGGTLGYSHESASKGWWNWYASLHGFLQRSLSRRLIGLINCFMHSCTFFLLPICVCFGCWHHPSSGTSWQLITLFSERPFQCTLGITSQQLRVSSHIVIKVLANSAINSRSLHPLWQ